MASNNLSDTLALIQKKQENIAVTIGVTCCLTMLAYFFMYARMADQGHSGMLWLIGITTILMVVILLNLKHVSFFIVRLWLGRRPAYQEAMASLSANGAADKRS